MAKIFFSYSWAQESLVTKIGNELGRDFVVQDKYNFEAGNALDGEMKNKIKQSDLFVFFFSREAFNSPNVQLELDYVSSLVFSNKIQFCPIFIDDSIDISDDWDRYEWIKKYLLSFVTNSSRIERIVRQKIRQLLCKTDKYSFSFFKGREHEKAEISREFHRSLNKNRRAVIVSGIPNIGRKSLLVNSLITDLDKTLGEGYEPISLSLGENDSIDSMILQLSEYSTITNVEKRLRDGDFIKLLVEMLNEQQSDNQKILVEDRQCIVLKNGMVVDWFLDVIQDKGLSNYTHLYIAAENTVAQGVVHRYEQIQSHRIQPLTKNDMHTIFVAYAKLKKAVCSDADADFFINRFNGYPKPILNVVDDIVKSGTMLAKKWLDNNLKVYDKTNKELIGEIEKNNDLYILVLTLTKVEYISYDILCEILPDTNVIDNLEKLFYMSIVESFGNKYYRLNRSLSDYINRNNIKIPEVIESRLRLIGQKSVEGIDDTYLDLSEKLISVKQRIKDDPNGVDVNLLLPSYSLKVLIDLYYVKEYESVQVLALRLLNDSKLNIYESVIRSVKYWLCLAASRNNDKDIFMQHVEFFFNERGKNATYFFLKGFFERCQFQYATAKKWYEKALTCNTDYEYRKYVAKVKHELALVYMKLDDSKALKYAKENYENGKDNTYHVETYYRCLVRSENPDIDVLHELINIMMESHDIYKDVIVETFNAEYKYYLLHDESVAINDLEEIIKNYPNTIQYPIDALKQIRKQKKQKDTDRITNILKKHIDVDDIYRFDEITE